MWYYELNHQSIGPVDTDAIEALLRAGTLNGLTLVWREGMPDWKHLDETDLAVLLRDNLQMPVTPVPPPFPRYAGYSPHPRVNLKSLNSLFTWWICLQAVGAVIVLAAVIGITVYLHSFPSLSSIPEDTVSSIFLVGFGVYMLLIPIFVAATVLLYILHYRLWQVVQDGFASTTPGMAIGLLFVPYFNLYWIFRATFGLSKDLNSYIDRHFPGAQPEAPRKAHPWISLTNIISSFAFPVIEMICFMLFMPKTDGTASLAASQAQAITGLIFIIIAVFIAVMFIMDLLTFADFYWTAKNILEKEEQA
jgi:hypothetical protein